MMQQRQNLKAKYDRSAAITPEASPDPEIIEKIPKKRSSSTLKTILFALAMALSLSMVVTDSLTFGYKIQFGKIRNYIIPRKKREQKEYTPAQLAEFTGENGSPIYLGIKGRVFDVTAGARHYGPKASYHHFAGKDASRAYVTGCFQNGLTPDLRGFSEKQLKDVDGWVDFYANHHTYEEVGTVKNPQMKDDDPLPIDCNAPKDPKPDT